MNIGNILLDENDDIKAIIDYAFTGIGDIYTDLTIISCRIDKIFFDKLIKEYEKLSNIKLNTSKLDNRQALRQYIENEYIKFMKIYHPEISI